MSETKVTPKAWTEGEKLGILFQIIERCAPIPWDELKLPEGRTKKAAQVMIDKEKTKVKRAREANGEETPSKGTKRKGKKAASDDGGNEEGSPKKKPRTPRKKNEGAKVTAGTSNAADGSANGGIEAADDAPANDEVADIGADIDVEGKKVAD